MKKIQTPMKTNLITLLILFLLIASCEDTTTSNGSSETPPTTTETPTDVESTTATDNRRPLYLQGVYATSNNRMVKNIFDGKSSSAWKTQKGTGSDEAIIIHFQNKIFVKKIEVELSEGGSFAKVDKVHIYGNRVEVNRGVSNKEIKLGNTYSNIAIRIGETNQDKLKKIEDDTKKGVVKLFSKNHSVGIKNIKMWDEDGKEYRLIPPREVSAEVTASSTLQPIIKYNTSHLFDTKKSSAWVEGAAGNGENEQLNFEFSDEVNIDEIQIWNGYQRSDSHYKTNARLKGFSLREIGGKSYEYTLRDSEAGQKIDLKVPVKKNFELKINSAYAGSKYKDLAISELLFFEDGSPLQFVTQNNQVAATNIKKAKGTILESLLNIRIANEMNYLASGFYAERSILFRTDGTFVTHLKETESEGDRESYITEIRGIWEIIKAGADNATLKISGDMLDMNALDALMADENEVAEASIYFTDKLTINNNTITAEKIFDEILF